MKKIMCFGTFDILHLGHLSYFKQAKEYGDYLIVVIARDRTKAQQKKEILFYEQERLELIQSLSLVDEAVLGDEQDHFKIIEEKKPDVLCLGYDHPTQEEELKRKLADRGLFPVIKRMKGYDIEKQKTHVLKEKLFRFS